jgi:hypothetical protein
MEFTGITSSTMWQVSLNFPCSSYFHLNRLLQILHALANSILLRTLLLRILDRGRQVDRLFVDTFWRSSTTPQKWFLFRLLRFCPCRIFPTGQLFLGLIFSLDWVCTVFILPASALFSFSYFLLASYASHASSPSKVHLFILIPQCYPFQFTLFPPL